mgnify:CR=1 FL=1
MGDISKKAFKAATEKEKKPEVVKAAPDTAAKKEEAKPGVKPEHSFRKKEEAAAEEPVILHHGKDVKLQKIEVEKNDKKGKKTFAKGHQAPAVAERLQTLYEKTVKPALVKEFGYGNVMEAPRLVKIVINMRVGKATADSKAIEEAANDLELIAGQKPLITKAKKSIANFHLREGQAIGAKVTLRRVRMYDFFDKLVNICLPRVRDFRGVSDSSFDGRGSYSLGVKEQLIFPEIEYDKVSRVQGMDITIVTSAKTDREAQALLKGLGMPFKK